MVLGGCRSFLLLVTTDCRAFRNLKTVTSYRSYSHSVQFFRPVKAIVRTDEANSMAFLQREFLPSNDTYKTKLLLEILYTLYGATKTSRIPRKAKRFFRLGIFCFEYPRRRSGKGNFYFANYRFSFRKLQIFISQTTDFHFANYRFPFRKLQIPISQTTDFHFTNYRFSFRKLQILISQTTDFNFANYRFPFRFVPFRFANYSKPFSYPWYSKILSRNHRTIVGIRIYIITRIRSTAKTRLK